MKKTCSKCKIEKSISEFNKVNNGKYGVRGDCTLCYRKVIKIHNDNNIIKRSIYYKNYNKIYSIMRKNK
jgi:hypothetical protein